MQHRSLFGRVRLNYCHANIPHNYWKYTQRLPIAWKLVLLVIQCIINARLSQGEVARVLSGTFSAESWTPARVANFVRLASNPAIARRTSGTRARGARRSIERA